MTALFDFLYKCFGVVADKPGATAGFGLIVLVVVLWLRPPHEGGGADWNFLIIAVLLFCLTALGMTSSIMALRRGEKLDSTSTQLSTTTSTLKPVDPDSAKDHTDLAILTCRAHPQLDEARRVASALNAKGSWGFIRYGLVPDELANIAARARAAIVTDRNHPEEGDRGTLRDQLGALGYPDAMLADNPGSPTRWFITVTLC